MFMCNGRQLITSGRSPLTMACEVGIKKHPRIINNNQNILKCASWTLMNHKHMYDGLHYGPFKHKPTKLFHLHHLGIYNLVLE